MLEKPTIAARSLSGKKDVVITITAEPLSIRGGGMEGKKLIEGTVAGRRVSMLERVAYLHRHYEQKWLAMKKVGLPVAPTVRISDTHTVLVTDLKADGSQIYGAGFFRAYQERPRPEIDRFFLEITDPHNFPAIREQMSTYTTLATKNNIYLPPDAGGSFKLLVKPDGMWKPVLLDLAFSEIDYEEITAMAKTSGFRPKNKTQLVYEFIAYYNNEGMEASLHTMKKIREGLAPSPVQGFIAED